MSQFIPRYYGGGGGATKSTNTPTNISPTSGATSVNLPVTLTASAYSGTDVHLHSIWSVYYDAGGVTEVYNSGASNDLTSHVVPASAALPTDTQYWFGVQYVGVSSISTSSALTSFTIDVEFSSLFATTIYTGNGATQDIVSGLDFVNNEGLVWVKNRDSASRYHYLTDTVRGATNTLVSNGTFAEVSYAQGLTAFNVDGFSVGNMVSVNESPDGLVAWQFIKKSGFFDIVQYTGDGVAGRTVALDLDDGTAVHGMSIVKNINASGGWYVQHKDISATNHLVLNTTAASTAISTIWNNTAATTTSLTLGTAGATNLTGDNYISYNFAHYPAKGIFCGSYTGTGAVGNKITTGFPVGWVLIKKASGAANWVVLDNVRGVTDASQKVLSPNISDAEDVSTFFDTTFDVDGFTLNNQRAELNQAGFSYIFMAIADPAQF